MEHILSVTEIMDAEDITEKTVPVEEWGGSVVVKSISYRQMRAIKDKVADKDNVSTDDISTEDVEKFIFIKGMVKPEISEEEYEHLLDKSYSAMTTILTEILGTSNTGDKAVKEEEKSFPDGQ